MKVKAHKTDAGYYVYSREVTADELQEMRAAWKEYRERDTLTPRRKADGRRRYVPYHHRPLTRRGRRKKITE
jgi:hypothetical protein